MIPLKRSTARQPEPCASHYCLTVAICHTSRRGRITRVRLGGGDGVGRVATLCAGWWDGVHGVAGRRRGGWWWCARGRVTVSRGSAIACAGQRLRARGQRLRSRGRMTVSRGLANACSGSAMVCSGSAMASAQWLDGAVRIADPELSVAQRRSGIGDQQRLIRLVLGSKPRRLMSRPRRRSDDHAPRTELPRSTSPRFAAS